MAKYNSICDKTMLASLVAIINPTARERFELGIVSLIIGTKTRFGHGVGGKKIAHWTRQPNKLGFKYILSIIGVFSKYGSTVPDAFQTVFKDRTPQQLYGPIRGRHFIITRCRILPSASA